MTNFIKHYFNKLAQAEPLAVATISNVLVTALILPLAISNSSSVGFVCAAITTLLAAGHANRWQEKATGQPFWKPRTLWGI